MHIFYCPELELDAELVELDETQSKHAIRVMRLNEGDQFEAINGAGIKALCEIVVPNKNKCVAKVLDNSFREKDSFSLGIAIAPTKNVDRIEWFCEKATEIGVDEIHFIQTKYSERKQIKVERLEKIVISAVKQSQRLYKPKLFDLRPLHEVDLEQRFEHILFAHCEDEEKSKLSDFAQKNSFIFIGPEGDFSKDEIKWAKENNFAPVSLGENRLRTETAGIVASTVLKGIG